MLKQKMRTKLIGYALCVEWLTNVRENLGSKEIKKKKISIERLAMTNKWELNVILLSQKVGDGKSIGHIEFFFRNTDLKWTFCDTHAIIKTVFAAHN